MLLELPGNVPLTQPVPAEPYSGLLCVVPLCECLLGKSAPVGGITGPEGLNSDLDRSAQRAVLSFALTQIAQGTLPACTSSQEFQTLLM